MTTDGAVDAQPYLLRFRCDASLRRRSPVNILYAASEHGSVYAFDATSGAGDLARGIALRRGAMKQPADSGSCIERATGERGITSDARN